MVAADAVAPADAVVSADAVVAAAAVVSADAGPVDAVSVSDAAAVELALADVELALAWDGASGAQVAVHRGAAAAGASVLNQATI